MSFIGNSPRVVRTRFTPQSTDPVNPQEGDFFVSDGSSQPLAGAYIYLSGAWQQVSTAGALTTVDSITFTPQSADPATPSEGEVFFSDGTTRTEGLWVRQNGSWIFLGRQQYDEFTLKTLASARVATTAILPNTPTYNSGAGTLTSSINAALSAQDGVTLVAADRILVKNQVSSQQNGVYSVTNVGSAGAPWVLTRATDADALSEINGYAVRATEGTTNQNNNYYLQETLTAFTDAQTWSTTPPAQSFTVPEGVEEISVFACGGGGGGGGGGDTTGTASSPGGAGGAGSHPRQFTLKVTSGLALSVTPGGYGKGAIRSAGAAATGKNGGNGGTTTVTGTGITFSVGGGTGGTGGTLHGASNTNGISDSWTSIVSIVGSGLGGKVNTVGGTGSTSSLASGGAGGASVTFGGGGGGGGAGFEAGGAGGSGSSGNAFDGTIGGIGAGGGGGGGAGNSAGAVTRLGGAGAPGGAGYVRISW